MMIPLRKRICFSTYFLSFNWQINNAQKALNMFIHLLSQRIFQSAGFQQTLHVCTLFPSQQGKENTPCIVIETHMLTLFWHFTTSFWLHHRIYFIANNTQRGCLYKTWQIVRKKYGRTRGMRWCVVECVRFAF